MDWRRRTALACGMLEAAADILPDVPPSAYACLASQLRAMVSPRRGRFSWRPVRAPRATGALLAVLAQEHEWLIAETDEAANLMETVAAEPHRIAPDAIGFAIAGQLRAMRSHRRWIEALLCRADAAPPARPAGAVLH